MSRVVSAALPLWGLEGAEWRLVAARENRVFKVEHEGKSYALRLHRAGYRSDAELRSELQWMGALARGGLSVPAPILSDTGDVLHGVDGMQVDLLTWLSGVPVGETGKDLKVSDRQGLFRELGRDMAMLHEISDAWVAPEAFERCRWDREGLLGETPLWDRFWENPTLEPEDKDLFLELRNVANAELARLEDKLDFGLIHADLVRENILIGPDGLQLIDFDDSGYGFRLFDIATALIKNMGEDDYPALQSALLDGYRSLRQIETSALELFMVLRAATYVGWIITRMEEQGASARNQRFIRTTRNLAKSYLASR